MFLMLIPAGMAHAQTARESDAEVIRQFDVELTPIDPATLRVSETITMDFGTNQRRGIFRNIPYRYERHTVKLVDVEVTDAEGKSRRAKITRSSGVLSIRIGDPDVFVTGEHIYVINYTARRAINFFDGKPEVYWNATGDEWPFPIEQVTATLRMPEGVDPGSVKTDSFLGVLGETRGGSVEVIDDALVFTADNLRGNEGLTILAELPEGSVAQATWVTALGWWLSDWWPAVVLPILSVGGMLALWLVRGRDEGANDAVPVEWDPPADMTPAEVGILIDEVCHTHDIIATVIDLAVRGYIRIEQDTNESGWVGLNKGSWTFVRLGKKCDKDRPLLPHEEDLLNALFKKHRKTVKLKQIKGKFYKDFGRIRDGLYVRMTERGFFTGNPDQVRNSFRGIGVLMITGALVFCFLSLANQWATFPWLIGVGLASLPIMMLAKAMPARTLEGSKMLRECRGFRRFLVDVERDRLADVQKDDPTLFGRLLPFAMVLGVEDQWAEQFEGLLTQEPDWYRGHRDGFVPGLFLSDFGRGVSQMGTSMTARPASSGAGGGTSGFSSGGGFSGGGFGGGGGGSW
ncbi:MAG: DUF2207 domain-containing protein [Planctomycetota bacterium]